MTRYRRVVQFLLSLIAITAITLHFLHWNSSMKSPNEELVETEIKNHKSSLNPTMFHMVQNVTPGYVLLPGNVVVHVGQENSKQNTTLLLNASQVCRDFKPSRVKLIIFINSRAKSHKRREIIRKTWGLLALQQALNFRIIYILGQSNETTTNQIMEESDRYEDLVHADFPDTFHNLDQKSVLGLQWTLDFCQSATFVAKTDDDILLHLPNLVAILERAQNPETLLLCNELQKTNIIRTPVAPAADDEQFYMKYAVDRSKLPGDYYPPYCSGFTFVFSRQVRDRLLLASYHTPLFFIDDVYLTGFCRYKARIAITRHSGFTLSPDITPSQAACSFKEGRLTSQEMNGENLQEIWTEMNTQAFFCH